MRLLDLTGIGARHKGRHRPAPVVHDELVSRRFHANAPDRL